MRIHLFASTLTIWTHFVIYLKLIEIMHKLKAINLQLEVSCLIQLKFFIRTSDEQHVQSLLRQTIWDLGERTSITSRIIDTYNCIHAKGVLCTIALSCQKYGAQLVNDSCDNWVQEPMSNCGLVDEINKSWSFSCGTETTRQWNSLTMEK